MAGVGEANSAGSALQVHPADNVAVALSDILAGARVKAGPHEVIAAAATPFGHKIALAPIPRGGHAIKYGHPIGAATAAIAPGEHVHTHNLKTLLDGLERYDFKSPARAGAANAGGAQFHGYRRKNGRVGVRNEIWVLATVGCVAKVAERIAEEGTRRHAGKIDRVRAITHPFGCSQLGDDLSNTRTILAALAANPNAGGAVFIGLGCESNQLDELLASAPDLDRARLRAIVAQEVTDEFTAGLAAVDELAALAAADSRAPCDLRDLAIGVKCGGSDGFSGLTANPLVGRMTDRVTGAGGASVLTEIPEIFGAERLLMERCESRETFDALGAVVNDFKQYFIDHDQPVSENPSPGNIAGGITTLEEKSLGAVQKAGAATVTDVLRYGERLRRGGLTILESPGNDAVSSTALVAAGAVIVLFTTGRGTPLGVPAPVIKIASNTALAARKPQWIDFDAGRRLNEAEGETERALFSLLLDVADGKPTCNELNGEGSIAIWKRGVVL